MEKPTDEESSQSKTLFSSILLRGFTEEDKIEFEELAIQKNYEKGDTLELKDGLGSMIYIVSGEISVYLGEIVIEKLNEGSSWGEETFIPSNAIFTSLKAESDAIVKHYDRKRIMDFFNYKGELLMKRFIINLLNIMYIKWKRSLGKIGSFMGYIPASNL